MTEGFIQVEGTVVSVNRQGEDVILRLDTGDRVPIDNVETIAAAPEHDLATTL